MLALSQVLRQQAPARVVFLPAGVAARRRVQRVRALPLGPPVQAVLEARVQLLREPSAPAAMRPCALVPQLQRRPVYVLLLPAFAVVPVGARPAEFRAGEHAAPTTAPTPEAFGPTTFGIRF